MDVDESAQRGQKSTKKRRIALFSIYLTAQNVNFGVLIQMTIMAKLLATGILMSLFQLTLAQTNPKNFTVKFTDLPVKLDGILDEPEWEHADGPNGFHQYFPSDSTLAQKETEIKMLYDATTLYIAVKGYSVGKNYLTRSLQRDFRGGGIDQISLVFDTFNDGTNAFLFGINPFGKTEMWYIMDADPGSKLIVGFNKDVEKEEYKKSLEENTLLDLLNYEEVTSGDTFFINTGKIHAIGAGVMLAEIQQTSDITYRVFDFNRKDKEGNLRELHTELALDAIDYKKKDDFKVNYSSAKDQVNQMVDCPYFKTNILDLTTDLTQDTSNRDSFTIYMCVEGSAVIANDYGDVHLQKGETILVPAVSKSVSIATKGVKLLEVTI